MIPTTLPPTDLSIPSSPPRSAQRQSSSTYGKAIPITPKKTPYKKPISTPAFNTEGLVRIGEGSCKIVYRDPLRPGTVIKVLKNSRSEQGLLLEYQQYTALKTDLLCARIFSPPKNGMLLQEAIEAYPLQLPELLKQCAVSVTSEKDIERLPHSHKKILSELQHVFFIGVTLNQPLDLSKADNFIINLKVQLVLIDFHPDAYAYNDPLPELTNGLVNLSNGNPILYRHFLAKIIEQTKDADPKNKIKTQRAFAAMAHFERALSLKILTPMVTLPPPLSLPAPSVSLSSSSSSPPLPAPSVSSTSGSLLPPGLPPGSFGNFKFDFSTLLPDPSAFK